MSRIERITSHDNARLTHVRKVRDGRVRSKIFVEGKRLALEAIRSRLAIDLVIFSEDIADREQVLNGTGVDVIEVSNRLFRSISDTENSQGVVLIAARPSHSSDAFDAALSTASLPVVLFFHEINNPSNLGAVMRTAEAAGVGGIIFSKNSADAYSSKSLRATMGAAFRLKIWEGAAFDEVTEWSRHHGLSIVAAEARGGVAYTDVDWRAPRLLVFGSEAHGLEPSHLAAARDRVAIPLEHGVESLNLAVSAGVILFEAKRQVEVAKRSTQRAGLEPEAGALPSVPSI